MVEGGQEKSGRGLVIAGHLENETARSFTRSRIQSCTVSDALGLGSVEGCMLLIQSYLEWRDLVAVEGCCRSWKEGLREMGWAQACDRDWKGKFFISEEVRKMREETGGSGNCKDAYMASILDSKRIRITEDELCSLRWCFRFKEVAGEEWVSRDSWWNGERADVIQLRRDHTCASSYTSDVTRWQFDQQYPVSRSGAASPASRQAVRTLRISLGGRDSPSYYISRHRKNWGWIMQNCWAIMTSWEMPLRSEPERDPDLREDAVLVTDQFLQVLAFNTGINNSVLSEHPPI